MKSYRQPSAWSTYCKIYTIVVIAVMIALTFITSPNKSMALLIDIIGTWLYLFFLVGLYFCPKYVEVNRFQFTIGRLFVKKTIRLQEVESAKTYHITMNFVNRLGSYGFFGFWGWYRNQELGKFFVSATNLKQLVVVKLKSGKAYVVSCLDADALSRQINMRLNESIITGIK